MSGKVVLISGGSKGIGRETARIFVQRGERVFICARDQQALAAAVGSLGPQTVALQADIRDPEQCKAVIQSIKEQAGRLDVLINNAGMSMRGSLLETDVTVLKAMAEINYLGAAYLTHYALPLLLQSKGSVVFVSSLAALHGLPSVGPYSSSKAALGPLSEALRCEIGPHGVHVGIVHVGFTENDADKRVYKADGTLIPINRPSNSQSQSQTAACIVRCVDKRKAVMVLTGIGKASALLYRLFPRFSERVVAKVTASSDMYGDKP